VFTHGFDVCSGAIDHPDSVGGAVGVVEPFGAGGPDGDEAERGALREDGGGDGDDGRDGYGCGEEARSDEVRRGVAVVR